MSSIVAVPSWISPLRCLCSFVKDQSTYICIFVWVFSRLSILFHWCIYLFFHQCHTISITAALQVCQSSNFVLLLSIAFAVLCLFPLKTWNISPLIYIFFFFDEEGWLSANICANLPLFFVYGTPKQHGFDEWCVGLCPVSESDAS